MTCRALLNRSSGSRSRQPNSASISTALRACKKPEEPAERLHIPAAGGLRHPTLHQRGDHPVDVVLGDLPRRLVRQREEPLQHPGAVIDRDLREPLRDLRARRTRRCTPAGRPPDRARSGQAHRRVGLRPPLRRARPLPQPPAAFSRPNPHTSTSPQRRRQHLTNAANTLKPMDSPGQQKERCSWRHPLPTNVCQEQLGSTS